MSPPKVKYSNSWYLFLSEYLSTNNHFENHIISTNLDLCFVSTAKTSTERNNSCPFLGRRAETRYPLIFEEIFKELNEESDKDRLARRLPSLLKFLS